MACQNVELSEGLSRLSECLVDQMTNLSEIPEIRKFITWRVKFQRAQFLLHYVSFGEFYSFCIAMFYAEKNKMINEHLIWQKLYILEFCVSFLCQKYPKTHEFY